jgi:hypothetical protein
MSTTFFFLSHCYFTQSLSFLACQMFILWINSTVIWYGLYREVFPEFGILRVIHWFQYTLLSPVLCFTFKYLMLEIGDARNFLWLHALTYVYFFPVVMLGDLFEPLILLCQCSDLVCCVSVQVFFYETCRFL